VTAIGGSLFAPRGRLVRQDGVIFVGQEKLHQIKLHRSSYYNQLVKYANNEYTATIPRDDAKTHTSFWRQGFIPSLSLPQFCSASVGRRLRLLDLPLTKELRPLFCGQTQQRFHRLFVHSVFKQPESQNSPSLPRIFNKKKLFSSSIITTCIQKVLNLRKHPQHQYQRHLLHLLTLFKVYPRPEHVQDYHALS